MSSLLCVCHTMTGTNIVDLQIIIIINNINNYNDNHYDNINWLYLSVSVFSAIALFGDTFQARTNNKINPHTLGPPWWRESALTTTSSLLPKITLGLLRNFNMCICRNAQLYPLPNTGTMLISNLQFNNYSSRNCVVPLCSTKPRTELTWIPIIIMWY